MIEQLVVAGVLTAAGTYMDIRQLNYLDGTTVDNGSQIWRYLRITAHGWYSYLNQQRQTVPPPAPTPTGDANKPTDSNKMMMQTPPDQDPRPTLRH